MKVRNGFVSNSSSSSFVITVNNGVLDVLTKDLSELERKIFDIAVKTKNGFSIIEFLSGDRMEDQGFVYSEEYKKLQKEEAGDEHYDRWEDPLDGSNYDLQNKLTKNLKEILREDFSVQALDF